MKRVFYINVILLLLFSLPSFSQTANPKIDSLKNLVAQSDNDSLRMEAYNQLRKLSLKTSYVEAMNYASEYLKLAEKLNYDFKTAIGNFYKANLYIQMTEYDSSLTHLFKTLNYFESQGDSLRTAMVLNSLGAAYENLGKDSLTINYFEKAYTVLNKLGLPVNAANALNNVSNIYFRSGDFQKSKTMLLQALDLLEEHKASAPNYPGIISNLTNSLLALKEYDEAENYLQQLVKMYKGKEAFNYVIGLSGLGKLYVAKHKYNKALTFLVPAYAIIKENKFYEIRADVLKNITTAYEKSGDTKKAFSYLKLSNEIRDSVFNEEKTKALNDALQKYEAEKKNQQISLLASQNKLQDLQIQKSQRERWAFILGLIGLGVIALLSFYNFRTKTKANEALEEKNKVIAKALGEKKLLLKEIHHRVKNNLQVISSLLRLQSKYIKDDTALDAISESRNRVRAMALLHQNLYQGENLKEIEVQEYLEKLITGLFETYNIQEEKIELQKNIQDISLDVDTLIPLGLIINELISNSLKYAFPDNQKGIIEISLLENQNQLELQVKDNGIGISKEAFQASRSFGNRMTKAFVEKLEGEMNFLATEGTAIQFVFSNYKK
ncbi:MAG TPA: tetratricopeptide repeat protein [Bacteroidetes bacterium]|nr:tetratricopeptide repeat protein [Bacteroidota bacterium]